MPSPFPGVDPYLESPAHWSDFHARFIFTLAEAVNGELPENYVARISEHVMSITPTLREEGEDDPVYVPDVAVLGSGETNAGPSGSQSIVSAPTGGPLVPVMLENIIFVDDYTESYVHVVRLPEMELVTVVELFSPTNKYGEGRGIYMKKRREFLNQKVNLVELDLIRAGGRLQFGKPLPTGHYHAFVSPADRRPQTDVYTWSVRDRLPVIPVPLRPAERAIHLDLSKPFSAAYDAGRYRRVIDYKTTPPAPSFSSADADWVRQITERPLA